jgi:hypothetical protein
MTRKILRAGNVITMVVIALLIAVPVIAATAWESYTTGDDAGVDVYGVNWYGQTFTVTPTSHTAVDVRLLIYRVGSPSTLTVSLREVGGDGMPTGDDLTNGTIDGDDLTTDTAGSWYGVTFTEYSLEYDEEYAICIRAEAGDSTNKVVVREDTSGTYTGGQAITSSSGGITWTAGTGKDIMFQIDGNELLEVYGAKVFNDYLEDDDMFIMLSYLNAYVPYYPNDICSINFWLQLRSTDGSTIYAQTVCEQWGYMPGSIYLNANQAASLTTGFPYRIYVAGAAAENPTAYYTLESDDWQGDALNLIPAWVMGTAHGMATYYDTAMTTQVQNTEVLNSEGGTLFATGIPSLLDTNPELFEEVVYEPGLDPIAPDGGTSFDTATTWEVQLGPSAAELANAMGGIIDIDGKYVVAGFFFFIWLGICYWAYKSKGDPIIATLLCIPLLLGCAWLRVIDFQLIAATGAVATLMTVYRFHWSRT